MIAAACLLVLFGFTSLYVTYQNGTDLNAAHASSGNNASDCIGPLLACAIAEMQADIACQEYGDKSKACKDAKKDAAKTCAKVPPGC